MLTNTSFRYRKNHLYQIKHYQAVQQTQLFVDASQLHVLLRSHRPHLLLTNTLGAFRRQLGRKTEKLFRLHVFRRPDTMVTAKPREIRMGKGKGAYSHVHLPVRAGSRLGYLGWCQRLSAPLVLGNLRQAAKKLGVSASF